MLIYVLDLNPPLPIDKMNKMKQSFCIFMFILYLFTLTYFIEFIHKTFCWTLRHRYQIIKDVFCTFCFSSTRIASYDDTLFGLVSPQVFECLLCYPVNMWRIFLCLICYFVLNIGDNISYEFMVIIRVLVTKHFNLQALLKSITFLNNYIYL